MTTSDLAPAIYGVTGDRDGFTLLQVETLTRLLGAHGVTTLHHGDCEGVDALAHDLARIAGLRIIVHPPDNPKHRAFCEGDLIYPPRPYLKRNQSMVNQIDHLIAVPRGLEHQRSGTWATVRYARTCGRPITIIQPDGRAEPEQRRA